MRRSPARGRWAEDRAVEYVVRERGARVLARNVRLAGGEIDLVVEEGSAVVFVEVKARKEGHASAAFAVSADKRRRIGRAAAAWVSRRGMPRGGCRFDVVTVGGDGANATLEYLPHAFETTTSWSV